MVRFKNFLFPLLSCLCLIVSPAEAQFADLLDQNPDKEKETAEPEVDIRDQLEKWREEVDTELKVLAKYETGELPSGVSQADFNTRRRHLEETQLAISRHLFVFEEIEKAEESIKASQAALDDWSVHGDKSPQSILDVDELIERKEAIEDKLNSQRSSIEVFDATLTGLLEETKVAEVSVEAALTAYEQAGEDDPGALWKLETERARQRSLFVRASALKHGITSFEKTIQAGEIDLALITKQIIEAGEEGETLTEEDIARIRMASADRQDELRREIERQKKRLLRTAEERSTAAEKLSELESAEGGDPVATELATLDLEAAKARFSSLRTMIECLEFLGQIEAFTPEAYEYRLALLGAESSSDRDKSLDLLETLNQRLSAWEVVTENELTAVAADITQVQSRAATFPTDDPRFVPLDRLRSVLWERQALIQRANQRVQSLRKSLERWTSETEDEIDAPWYAPVASVFKQSWASLESLWNIPISKYEETIEIDGQSVVQVRLVSLGSIILALVLFIITYLIAARFSRRVQRVLVSREVMGENQARTLRNWAMLLVGFLLALATLAWLSIPLTVFAFLAGALAIGIGFGTQTMIKNFISGIILLVERKVRVGDIVEVDGTLGIVSEINTRSSIVRGFNGIENLIPNSLFLENRIVNWTLDTRFIRRELKVGVAYGSPVQDVIKILNEVADRHGLALKDPPPFAVFSDFGDSSLDFVLYFWIELNDRTNTLVVESDLRIMIEKRFSELGIGVPFPQRDIHLGTAEPIQVEIGRKSQQDAPAPDLESKPIP